MRIETTGEYNLCINPEYEFFVEVFTNGLGSRHRMVMHQMPNVNPYKNYAPWRKKANKESGKKRFLNSMYSRMENIPYIFFDTSDDSDNTFGRSIFIFAFGNDALKTTDFFKDIIEDIYRGGEDYLDFSPYDWHVTDMSGKYHKLIEEQKHCPGIVFAAGGRGFLDVEIVFRDSEEHLKLREMYKSCDFKLEVPMNIRFYDEDEEGEGNYDFYFPQYCIESANTMKEIYSSWLDWATRNGRRFLDKKDWETRNKLETNFDYKPIKLTPINREDEDNEDDDEEEE